MSAPVSLSLISHTNVGKTTLARTLLRRDVGEVRDFALNLATDFTDIDFPGRTMSPVIISGRPTAATRMSARCAS